MKTETAIIITKALCFTAIGAATPFTTGLSQWANEGTWPSRVNWIVLIAGAVVGAFTQLLSFLSQSYGQYMAGRSANGNGNGNAVKPAAPDPAKP